ncbi:MAG: Thiol-disulfide oxidoreductase ResA [Calditrichaeota bacterium]|nr:Thiol-disulfide oxidoreductase ResA [Calditrichota bacterium]
MTARSVFPVAFVVIAALFAGPAGALDVGDTAPDFTLADTNGVEYTLSDYLGHVVVLQFMGCT